MIIFRYLAKEIYAALCVVIGVLMLIFLSNQFVRYLTRAANGKLSGIMVMKIMALEIPYLLGLLLPVGLFLAILLAYGRLYVDSEMTVLNTCGLGKRQLLKVTMIIASGVFVLAAVMSLVVNPLIMKHKDKILLASPASLLLQTLSPGRFVTTPNGKNVFYIEDMSRNKKTAENIFVAQREIHVNAHNRHPNTQPLETWKVISAGKGYQYLDKKTGHHYLVAENGYEYSGVPGGKAFRIVKFGQYGVKMAQSAPISKRNRRESMSTTKLWKRFHGDSKAAAELQWRFSIPLSIPILVLLAIPLSRVKPRRGRYAQLLPSILIYTIYANMMFVARDWVEDGVVSPYIGMWWLHLLLFFLALLLYIDTNSWKSMRQSCKQILRIAS